MFILVLWFLGHCCHIHPVVLILPWLQYIWGMVPSPRKNANSILCDDIGPLSPYNDICRKLSILCIVVVLLLIYRQAIFGLLIFGLGAFIYLIGCIFGIDWNVFNLSSPQLLVGILGTGVLLIGILGLAVFREINNI